MKIRGTDFVMYLVSDLTRAAFRGLKGKGARVLNPPADHGVCRHLDVLDPDGNLVILHRRANGPCGQG